MTTYSGDIKYTFEDWSIDALSGALRAMAFEDPSNEHKLRFLEECATRLLMQDAALALTGNSAVLENQYYKKLASQGVIQAIKKYREDKGVSLRDAKHAIEALL